MSEATRPSSLLAEALQFELEEIVQRAVERALNGNRHQEGDELLDAEAASKILAVSPDWLYHHHKKLPFTRKLAPRVLRFSRQGIQKYMAAKKVS